MNMSFDFLANLTVTTVMEANILYSFKPKTHVTNRKHWSFLIKSTGETHYICNGKQYTCNQNNVIVAPSGCSYEYNSIIGGEFAFLNFDALQTYTDFIQIPEGIQGAEGIQFQLGIVFRFHKHTQAVLEVDDFQHVVGDDHAVAGTEAVLHPF